MTTAEDIKAFINQTHVFVYEDRFYLDLIQMKPKILKLLKGNCQRDNDHSNWNLITKQY